jgi:Protein of unknown function (DUF4235)
VPKRSSSDPSPIVVGVATLVGAAIAGKAAKGLWRGVTGSPPPEDPASADEDIVVSMLWTAASAALIALTRVMIKRGLAARAANGADEH